MKSKAALIAVAVGIALLGALTAELPSLVEDLMFLHQARLAVQYGQQPQSQPAPKPTPPPAPAAKPTTP